MRSGGWFFVAAVAFAAQEEEGERWMPPHVLTLSGSEKGSVALEMGLDGIRGRASYDLAGRTVHVRWVYEVAGLTDSSMFDPTSWCSTQSIAVDLWPTEVCAAGPRQLAVAGVTPFGMCAIQLITFAELDERPALTLDARTGERLLPELSVPVLSVRTVHQEPVGESRYVAAMFQNRGRAGRLFVKHLGARELQELELESGTTRSVAVADAPAGSGVLLAPGLAREFNAVDDGEHDALGHLYWFVNAQAASLGWFVLADADRDGTLDASELVLDPKSGPGCTGRFLSKR